MKNKIIIFDMDGVIYDSIPIAEEFYLKSHPGMTSEMYKMMHSGNFHEESKKYSHFKIEETEEERLNRHILYAEIKRDSKMFDGMMDLLKDLHKDGYLLVLNTNAFNRNCLPLLEKSGITHLFDFIATAELSKSKIEKFKLIEDKYNITRENFLFITDSIGDVKEAEIAKVPTIAVTWGVHNKTFFEKGNYSSLVAVVNTVEELSQFIKK